jgi:hypothetical protein
MITGVSKEQEILNSTMDKAKEAAKGAIETVTKMKNTFDLAKDGVISKEDALKEYNDTIGKTIGEAKTLEEAEEKFTKSADAYVKSAMLRAQAQEIIKIAAEEASQALIDQEEDARTWADQTVGFINDVVASAVDYSTAGLTDLRGVSKDINEGIAKDRKEARDNERIENQKRYAELINDLTRQAEEIEKANNFEVEADKKKEEQLKKQREDARKKRLEAEKKALDERLALLAQEALEESQFIEKKTALEDEYLQSKLEKEQQEVNAVYDKYFALIEAAKQYGEDTALLEEAQQAAIKEIQDRYQAEREAAAKAERLKKANLYKQSLLDAAQRIKTEEDLEIALRDAKIEMAQQSLQAISDLVTAFAGESEEAQRRAFNINKAISIGQAIISTAQGIITQLAVPQDALTGANFVKAGIVAATGAAQIATISATQFQASGSGGGGGGTTPTAPNPPTAVSSPATFNVVGNTGTNQLAETLGQQPLQAYVVAGDVTTAQSLERNKIQQSTL